MSSVGEWFRSGSLVRVIPWVFILALVCAGGYLYSDFKKLELAFTNENLTLKQSLAETGEENSRLQQELGDKLYIIESFEEQIRSMSSVVGDLQKLSQTDEELLRKYSKVSFLNENYTPSKLTEIRSEYVLVQNDVDILIHADVWPYLQRLLRAAENDDIDLRVSSAFRSFDAQAALKSGYTVMYGTGANRFSADQGFSEHQLGTTVDFATISSGPASTRFESDPAFTWLKENAHKYGFVLSYPKGNSYYIFEPWHWRFVGTDLASVLHREGENFYDLDQREIDKYLLNLFD